MTRTTVAQSTDDTTGTARLRTLHLLVGVVLVAGLVVGTPLALTAPVAGQAQPIEDPVDCEREVSDLFDGEDSCVDWSALGAGALARVRAFGGDLLPFGPDGPTAAEAASDAAAQVNTHAAAYLAYGNAVDAINATENVTVVEVTFEVDGETATRYLVAEGNATTGEWTALRAVNATNHSVDLRRTLSGDLATNADEELRRIRSSDWFGAHERPSNSYVSRMAGRYGRETLRTLVFGGDDGDGGG